jgi:DNA-binding protein H-NS
MFNGTFNGSFNIMNTHNSNLSLFEEATMATLEDLIAQKAALEKQIEEARKTQLADAIAAAKAIIDKHGLTADDLFGGRKAGRAPTMGKKVAPKYRDPATGATWTGRGRAPVWLKDKNPADYLIG